MMFIIPPCVWHCPSAAAHLSWFCCRGRRRWDRQPHSKSRFMCRCSIIRHNNAFFSVKLQQAVEPCVRSRDIWLDEVVKGVKANFRDKKKGFTRFFFSFCFTRIDACGYCWFLSCEQCATAGQRSGISSLWCPNVRCYWTVPPVVTRGVEPSELNGKHVCVVAVLSNDGRETMTSENGSRRKWIAKESTGKLKKIPRDWKRPDCSLTSTLCMRQPRTDRLGFVSRCYLRTEAGMRGAERG